MAQDGQDTGASADADRAVVNGASTAVSALWASVPSADRLQQIQKQGMSTNI